jgi:bifunctional UDP-N-acetylglucosamine pyrophosphorylase/glucosamine-1-phosphate N-acetyltransferase
MGIREGDPMKVAAVLLAAGQGTRMRSALPKVLHTLCGKPMLWHALEAIRPVSTETRSVVARATRSDSTWAKAECVLQEPQLGTAHAAMQAEATLRGRSDLVIVAYADMPLLRPETFQRLVETQQKNSGPVTMMSVMAGDPRGFGRVVRGADGTVQAIVEEYVATPEQLQIHELNVGAHCLTAWPGRLSA